MLDEGMFVFVFSSLASIGGRVVVAAGLLLCLFPAAAQASTPLPSTRLDFEMPGTQPGTLVAPLAVPSNCTGCHSNYGSPEKEPWRTWQGSMVAQAGRDPLTYAAMAVANQDAPHSGDTCIRCHMPKGWLEGRSEPEDASSTTAADRHGVQCTVCHRLVDPTGAPGNPPQDAAILAALTAPVTTVGGGQMVVDPDDSRRGPFDVVADLGYNPHAPAPTYQASYSESSRMCGTCHVVLNPVYQRNMAGDYEVSAFDAPGDPALGFPEQQTYTEWENSSYSAGGIYAPQFAGDGNGIEGDYTVGNCQSCHMPGVTGKGASSGIERSNMPVHDLVGANTFMLSVISQHPVYGAEVDATVLSEGAERALRMLRRAATVAASIDAGVLSVKVTNETGHKLPTGYPDGRRMWLHVRALDKDDNVVFESGRYDTTTAEIDGYEAAPMAPEYDATLHVWEIHQGMSADVAMMVGLPAGPSFHLALNNVRESDNRIPPRGFTNAAFDAADVSPVGYAYADGQYWDDVTYPVGNLAVRAEVELLYQTTTKEYVEFLRDENYTDTTGDTMYDLWLNNGKGAPVEMVRAVVDTDAKVIGQCRKNIDKLQSKYLKSYTKAWDGCFTDSAAGESCDAVKRDEDIAKAQAALRAKLGGASDKLCEGAGLTPTSVGLGSYCPAPCAAIVLFDLDDVSDCSICLAEDLSDTALVSAYGTTPPTTPATVPDGDSASCQKNLAKASTGLAIKWASAWMRCESDNFSGKNDPAIDCTTDPKGKIAKAQESAAKRVDKCATLVGLGGCADGAANNAAAYQCIEDAIEPVIPVYAEVAYP